MEKTMYELQTTPYTSNAEIILRFMQPTFPLNRINRQVHLWNIFLSGLIQIRCVFLQMCTHAAHFAEGKKEYVSACPLQRRKKQDLRGKMWRNKVDSTFDQAMEYLCKKIKRTRLDYCFKDHLVILAIQ